MNPASSRYAASTSPASTAWAAIGQARRVLVVGAADWAGNLSRELSAAPGELSVLAVENYLMALGQVATAPPALVIGHMDGLDGTAPATIAALKRLTPESSLLLLAKPEQESAARLALDFGFDRYLIEPVRLAALLGTLVEPPPAPSAAAARPTPAAASQKSQAVGQVKAIDHAPAVASSAVAAGSTRSDLTDVDLFSHLLEHEQGITDLALETMAQRTGLRPVGWCAAADQVPAGRARHPVTFLDQTLGYLHVPGATVTAAAMQPWADWLGRWLALERRIAGLKHLALTDELTGLWNRRYFDRKLTELLARAAQERFRVTLMIFDIDDFKVYNDRYGHAAGDEILSECARLMRAEVRTHDIVARIGGDEFAVIFWDAEQPRRPNSRHPIDVRLAAERFQRAVAEHRFPKLARNAPGTLTISAGLAGFPWDGRTTADLFDRADAMARQSKQNGKNILTFGPGAMRSDSTTSG